MAAGKVVVAAAGYPAAPQTGDVIYGLEAAAGVAGCMPLSPFKTR